MFRDLILLLDSGCDLLFDCLINQEMLTTLTFCGQELVESFSKMHWTRSGQFVSYWIEATNKKVQDPFRPICRQFWSSCFFFLFGGRDKFFTFLSNCLKCLACLKEEQEQEGPRVYKFGSEFGFVRKKIGFKTKQKQKKG